MSFKAVQPQIAECAQGSPEGLAHVLTFVLLTIQQPLESVPLAQASVKRQGAKSKYLFGPKRAGYRYLQSHKAEIYSDLQACGSVEERLTYVANLPGFGLPKAGFVLQLVYGEAGCLDTHNLERFGITASKALQIKGQTKATQARKARKYLRLCEDCGGVESLWDTWCEYVSAKRPYVGTAEHVSRLHLNAIGG